MATKKRSPAKSGAKRGRTAELSRASLDVAAVLARPERNPLVRESRARLARSFSVKKQESLRGALLLCWELVAVGRDAEALRILGRPPGHSPRLPPGRPREDAATLRCTPGARPGRGRQGSLALPAHGGVDALDHRDLLGDGAVRLLPRRAHRASRIRGPHRSRVAAPRGGARTEATRLSQSRCGMFTRARMIAKPAAGKKANPHVVRATKLHVTARRSRCFTKA